jgi:hypothetical protein
MSLLVRGKSIAANLFVEQTEPSLKGRIRLQRLVLRALLVRREQSSLRLGANRQASEGTILSRRMHRPSESQRARAPCERSLPNAQGK